MPIDKWTGKYRPVIPLCPCGSGELHYEIKDARGIFLTFACIKCRKEKLSHFRPDVLTNPNYPADEPIEEDE